VKTDRPVLGPDRVAELEDERTFLLTSLEDLDREDRAGDLDADDERELRDAYTSRLAAVLKELAGQEAARPPKPPRRWGRLAAIAGGIAVVAIGAGIAVAALSGQRLPGASVSGDVADSVNAKLAEARSLQESDPKSAIDRYDEVLKVDPDNAEALTYRGWLVARVGATAGAADLVDKGEQALDRAIQVSPTYADPYCFKAIIEFRYRNDPATAKGPVDVCLAANPPQVVRALVEGLQAEITAAIANPSATNPPATTAPAAGTTVAPSTTLGG
jgi:tetratricopeptide (TPR) repeat protein